MSAVGRFILFFGHIEWYTYQMLVHLPTESTFDAIGHLRFVDRANLCIALLDDERFSKSAAKPLQKELRKAIALATARNVVAHNPVMLSIYAAEPGDMEFRQEIGPFRIPDKRMSLRELQQRAEESQRLAGAIYEHLHKVFADCT